MKKDGNEFHYPPKPGDGTQPSKRPWRDANWFGPSCEPQEEFIDEFANLHTPEPPPPPQQKNSAEQNSAGGREANH